MTVYAVRNDGQGWRAVDGEFADPDDPSKSYPDPEVEKYSDILPPNPIPGKAEVTATALAWRDDLLSQASLRIAPLQDAVDLDAANPEDVALLVAWKSYRVALNKIQDQKKFPEKINWPIAPA